MPILQIDPMMSDDARKILILKTGSTFESTRNALGDFENWIRTHAVLSPQETEVVDASGAEDLPMYSDFAGVIITGSHAMVTDGDEWIGRALGWIADAVKKETPVLGICFGHQMLARAMGGEVDNHPRGLEIGTKTVFLTPAGSKDPLLGDMPLVFPAHTTHAQTVTRLPQKALLLASNPFEPHHAFRIGRCAWGVQFHPEFSTDAMRAYIDEQREVLMEGNQSLSALKEGVLKTAAANALLKRFKLLCRQPPPSI